MGGLARLDSEIARYQVRYQLQGHSQFVQDRSEDDSESCFENNIYLNCSVNMDRYQSYTPLN